MLSQSKVLLIVLVCFSLTFKLNRINGTYQNSLKPGEQKHTKLPSPIVPNKFHQIFKWHVHAWEADISNWVGVGGWVVVWVQVLLVNCDKVSSMSAQLNVYYDALQMLQVLYLCMLSITLINTNTHTVISNIMAICVQF